jgi:hypothetical protein
LRVVRLAELRLMRLNKRAANPHARPRNPSFAAFI